MSKSRSESRRFGGGGSVPDSNRTEDLTTGEETGFPGDSWEYTSKPVGGVSTQPLNPGLSLSFLI